MIRVANLDDVPAIASIRIRAYREIYRGDMPGAFLDGLDPAATHERWRVMIDGTTPRSRILVSEENNKLTCFIALEPAPEPNFGYAAYLSALYVDPEIIGRGLGRALFNAGYDWMRAVKYPGVFWWVIGVNRRARAFYEKMGAAQIPGADRTCPMGGKPMLEHAYGMRL